jgi:hypothetical protein
MMPTYEVEVTLKDPTRESIIGKLMYVIVWEGKALSGGEVLVNGEDIQKIVARKAS